MRNIRKEIESDRRVHFTDWDEIEVYGSSYDKVTEEWFYQWIRRGFGATDDIEWLTPPSYTIAPDGAWRCYAKFRAW